MSSRANYSLILPLLALAFLAAVRLSPTPPAATAADPAENYATYCAGCHGEQMEAFVDRQWVHGSTDEALYHAIAVGYPNEGMPGFDTTFTDAEIKALVEYIQQGIRERRQYDFTEQPDPTKDVYEADSFRYRLELVTDKVNVPWGMTFLPGGEMLIADKGGTLYRRTPAGQLQQVTGAPPVVDRGQGGLMDVELHPDFENNQLVYLSYSKPGPGSGATTAILRARLDGNRLVDEQIIFEAQPYRDTRHHYGSRLEFDREGKLFLSVGDRGGHQQLFPQKLDNHLGKVHRINDDGSIPEDNPYVGQEGALPSIYSLGHRNPQGVTMQPSTGEIWTHEHGPRGGDEVNVVKPGLNFGWPVISYGINYNGTVLTDKTAAPGLEQPLHYWVPSIAPCGMDFVEGGRYPGWEGSLLVGSLRFKYLARCVVRDGKIVEEDQLLKNIGRLRNVEVSPDGYIYVATEEPGRIYRLVPLEEKG